MAVPTIQSATVSTESATGSPFTLAMPSTRPDGDLYVAIAGHKNSDAWGVPGNFNTIIGIAAGLRAYMAAYWWVGSSEPASYSLTLAGGRKWGIVYHITGFDATPVNISGSDKGTTSANGAAPSVTTTAVDTLVFRAITTDNPSVTATPATEDTKGAVGGGGGAIGYGASHVNGPNPAGATGAAAFTHAAGLDWCTITFAIEEDQTPPSADVIIANRLNAIRHGSGPVNAPGLGGNLIQ